MHSQKRSSMCKFTYYNLLDELKLLSQHGNNVDDS